jgi:hypothetical protein
MEAIAHSPSFAKKAGVPQSVGKDYAEADKGKTFKRGGDMKKGYADGGMPMVNKGGKMVPSFAADGVGKMAKGGMAESKKMVDKEVAFMKKKGAPAKMIKHEMSEMKGMKAGGRVRRMSNGGMGEGDPFARDIDYEKEKERGAKTVEGIKNFLGFGKKEETKPNPVSEGSKPVSSTSPTANAVTSPVTSSAVKTPERASAPNNRTLPVLNEESGNKDRMLSGPQYTSSIATDRGELDGDGLSPVKKPALKAPVNKAKPAAKKSVGFEKVEKKERVITEPVSKTPFKSDSPDLEGREESMKPKRKIGLASDETRASVRKGLGSALDFFNLSKAHEREFGKKAAKGGSVKRMRYGGSPEDGMDMGQPMRGMASPPAPRGGPMPAMGPEMNPNSIAALQAKYGMRPQGGPPMKAGGSVKKMAEGGYAKADGAASRGKTQPKMVKMAKGGFVKNADGCAQRGKTKAFQVKMKNGGMC